MSHAVATRVCRLKGVLLDCTRLDVIRRGAGTPETVAPSAFSLRHSLRDWLLMARLLGVWATVVLGLLVAVTSVPGTAVYGYLLAGGIGLAAAGCWLAHRYKLGFMGRVAEGGVTAAGRHWFTTRSVTWAEVESCEVTVLRTAYGRVARPLFVFKDAGGRVVLTVTAVGADEPDTAAFRAAVERYLLAR